jgi:hypothetical protein
VRLAERDPKFGGRADGMCERLKDDRSMTRSLGRAKIARSLSKSAELSSKPFNSLPDVGSVFRRPASTRFRRLASGEALEVIVVADQEDDGAGEYR